MDEKVLIDPSLEGKTREEMGLEPFRYEEIRSSVLGIPVVISVDTIVGVIRRASEERYVYGLKNKKSSWIPIVNRTLYNSSTKGKYKDMDMRTRMLLKIQSENLLPKGSGGDKPSLDHKVFLHFFFTRERANVPKYIFKHLIKSLEDSQTIKKNFVPYGRLRSEIFHQFGVLDALKNVNCFTDAQLGTVAGRIINGATLVTMKLISKEDHQELSTELKESSVISNLMDDFPPICKQDPLEVRVLFIKEYYEMTGQVIKISDIPDEMYRGALPNARNRKSLKRKLTEAEYLGDTPEFAAKVAKTSAPETHPPASDMIIPQQEALEADDSEHEDPENVVEISSGKMINGRTLQNMKIIKKFSPNEKDLKESTAPTKLMKDFPPIYQERNPEVLAKLVADSVKESGISLDAEAPEVADAPLQVRRKTTSTDAGSEASGAQTKKSRKDTFEASAIDNSSAPIPKRKRRILFC